jgi:hypothetical protein
MRSYCNEHLFACQGQLTVPAEAVKMLAVKLSRLIEIAVGLSLLIGLIVWGWLTHGIR